MVIQLGGLSSCSYKTQQTENAELPKARAGRDPWRYQVQPAVESRDLDLDDPGCLQQRLK